MSGRSSTSQKSVIFKFRVVLPLRRGGDQQVRLTCKLGPTLVRKRGWAERPLSAWVVIQCDELWYKCVVCIWAVTLCDI